MSLPGSYSVKTETATFRRLSALTYEILLPKYGQYIHNLMLVCNPIIVGRNILQCVIELCFSNIQTISLCINDTNTIVLCNTNTENQTIYLSDLSTQYNLPVDFFNGSPIVTEALYKVIPSIRIQFYKEPNMLPHLHYDIHFVDKSWHSILQNTPIYVQRSDVLFNNSCHYKDGVLWF